MSEIYDLNKLGPEAFENMVNFLALKVLGAGASGFGPGADGGRDGYFEGEAPFPNEQTRWRGVWYIQSKFHKPHLSKDPQKWLIEQVKKEIATFDDVSSGRIWPTNWIIATNIDQSGKPETGSFDAIKKLLKKSPIGKKVNLAVWGGRRILDFLSLHQSVAEHYGHFLTPGHIISSLYAELSQEKTSLQDLMHYFVVTQFNEHTYTKLDQAGSSTDVRPNVQDLFIDVPFTVDDSHEQHPILATLCYASAQCHRYSLRKQYPLTWSPWNKNQRRARVSLLKGGPGQGKSTIGQYLCQIHRAKLILADDEIKVIDSTKAIAKAVYESADRDNFWPESARIPIQIELKEYAHWYSQRPTSESLNVLCYIAETVQKRIGIEVKPKTVKSILAKKSWIVVFDGLDEVPSDHKDKIAKEILHFLNDLIIEIDGDVFAICTSRPQGYSGQFSGLDGPVLNLSQLNPSQALLCATPLLKFGRNIADADLSINTLTQAISSPSIQELMTTPLQSHIMAIVVRDGGRPPERRWQLFHSFYLVMKKRESMKNFQNPRIAKLLREEDRLLKSVHMRLGFVLHAHAETSDGAQTTMNKSDFKKLVTEVVRELDDFDVEATVADVMEATTERLVLVSTPENGNEVRFDIRQLQEFFAAEFIYAGVDSEELAKRIDVIGGDAHWREVMHFLISALIVNQRSPDLAITVQTLRQLNEGDESGVNAIYSRRTAKAALLASRLLGEGVLEQDQRDRQQLRPLVEKIGGIFDISRLIPLTKLGESTRSKQWLNQICFNVATTANATEAVGAIYLLGWNVVGDIDFNDTTRKAFLSSPHAIKEVLFKSWAPREGYKPGNENKNEKGRIISQWVFDAIADILNSEDWKNYSSPTINDQLRIFSSSVRQAQLSLTNKNISTNIAEMISICLSDESKLNLLYESPADCGMITERPYTANWKNNLLPPYFLELDFSDALLGLNGYFELLLVTVKFTKNKSEILFNKFMESVKKYEAEHIINLPKHILALVPVAGNGADHPGCAAHLRKASYSDFNSVAESSNLRPFSSELQIKDNILNTEDEWRQLAALFPSIAINFLFKPHGILSMDPVLVPDLVQALRQFPHYASSSILKWGELERLDRELFLELKNNLSILPQEQVDFWHAPRESMSPFRILLPQDANLINLLAPAFIKWWGLRILFGENEIPSNLMEQLHEFGLSEKILKSIFRDPQYDKSVHASVLSLRWILAISKKNIDSINLKEEIAFYLEFVNTLNFTWLTDAFLQGVLSHFSERSVDAVCVISQILEKCRLGSVEPVALFELLNNWYERSNAPVTTKKLMAEWLSYKFEASRYHNKT